MTLTILILTIVLASSAALLKSRYLDSERTHELFADLIEEDEDFEPTGAGSVKKTKASEVWENIGNKMFFLFDYGDSCS